MRLESTQLLIVIIDENEGFSNFLDICKKILKYHAPFKEICMEIT